MFMRSLDQDNLVLTTHNQEEELGKPKLSGMPIHIQIKLRRSKNSKKKIKAHCSRMKPRDLSTLQKNQIFTSS